MGLTEAERAEFIELSEAAFDAALWDEADLPILRKAKREYEEEQARERAGALPAEEPTQRDDDGSIKQDPYPA
jgi:hypothetical protein